MFKATLTYCSIHAGHAPVVQRPTAAQSFNSLPLGAAHVSALTTSQLRLRMSHPIRSTSTLRSVLANEDRTGYLLYSYRNSTAWCTYVTAAPLPGSHTQFLDVLLCLLSHMESSFSDSLISCGLPQVLAAAAASSKCSKYSSIDGLHRRAAEQKPGRTAGRMIAPVLEQLSRDYVGEASFYKASRVLASTQPT